MYKRPTLVLGRDIQGQYLVKSIENTSIIKGDALKTYTRPRMRRNSKGKTSRGSSHLDLPPQHMSENEVY